MRFLLSLGLIIGVLSPVGAMFEYTNDVVDRLRPYKVKTLQRLKKKAKERRKNTPERKVYVDKSCPAAPICPPCEANKKTSVALTKTFLIKVTMILRILMKTQTIHRRRS